MSQPMQTVRDAANRPGQEAVAEILSRLLADTYVLALKTRNYHWNVTGPQFPALHTLFETQYRALGEAGDEVAERIRALGYLAPGSYAAYAGLTAIEEETGQPDAGEMVRRLQADHETLAQRARALVGEAEGAGDPVTVDLATQRAAAHEKAAWMLRSTLA